MTRRLAVVSKFESDPSPEAHRVITEVRQAIVTGGPIVQVVLDVIANKSSLGPQHTKALVFLLMSLEAETHGQKARSDHLLTQAEAALT